MLVFKWSQYTIIHTPIQCIDMYSVDGGLTAGSAGYQQLRMRMQNTVATGSASFTVTGSTLGLARPSVGLAGVYVYLFGLGIAVFVLLYW